jgi:hypothetical protein
MQTVYDQYEAALQLGNIYDTFHPRQVDSYLAQGAVGVAKAVVLGTATETDTNRGQIVQAGTGAGQGALIVGITILSQTLEQVSGTGVVQYSDKSAVPVMKKGRVVVETNDAVVAGAPANFVLANGKWTDAAVGAGIEAPVLIKARFVTGTTGAGLAALEIQSQ